jgi:hypothetical protein
MQERYKQLLRYVRLLVKPIGLICTLTAIGIFGAQILQTMGEAVGNGWLVLILVGVILWLLDVSLSTFDDWGKLSKEIEEHSQSSK